MGRKNWIDKKTAAHFTLVFRPQNDPLIHDSSASSLILNPTIVPNLSKSKKLNELALELGSEVEKIRENEGEAASHGIYFDDTEYDYMQHMRDLGCGFGESHFVEASSAKNGSKAKGKQPLEKALKNPSLQDHAGILLDKDILPSKNLRKGTYQAQQDVPDVLAGFQPEMDHRLREVLVALEDDSYVVDKDDIFCELAKDNEEITREEFEQNNWDDGETDWDSDETEKPTIKFKDSSNQPRTDLKTFECEEDGDGNWIEGFNKFKRDQKSRSKFVAPSVISSLKSSTTNSCRRKKRKGAITNPSSYSMTSSSLFRTEGLDTLDARFEKIEEQYNEDIDDRVSVSQSSLASTTYSQGPLRDDFNSIMDEFLGSCSVRGKNEVKKGKYQGGIKQLDEIRSGLGPAIVRS